MNIKIIVVGSIKEEFYRNKINYYIDKISKKDNIQLIELKDESIPKNAGEAVMQEVIRREGERILSNIDNTDYVIALCIEGRATDGNMLKKVVKRAARTRNGAVTFVIGGSLGLSEQVVKRADYELSFSKMTFPHQLMRVMLLEQIYYCLTCDM